MAKILDNTFFNGNISKVVELPDEYIFNGQIYDKSTLSPVPLQFMPIPSSQYNEMFLNRNLPITNLTNTWNKIRNDNALLIDNTNANVTYIAKNYYFTPGAIYKINREDKNNYITTCPINFDGAYHNVEFIDQDDFYIYLVINRNNAANYITKVNKSTMTIVNNVNVGAGQISILSTNESFIYLSLSYDSNIFKIFKYNRVSTVLSILLDDSKTGNSIVQSIPKLNATNTTYAIRDGFFKDSKTHMLNVFQYNINTSNDSITSNEVTLDLSILASDPKIISFKATNGCIGRELFTFEDNNINYAVILRYNNGLTIQCPVDECNMFVFKIDNETHWTLIQQIYFAPLLYTGCMPFNDNRSIMLVDPARIHFYTWNSTSTQYELTSTLPKQSFSIGIDLNNNIFVQNIDKSIESESAATPIKIVSDIDKDVYNFVGEEISTFANVYAENFSGQYLTCPLELRLSGPAVFVDNNEKTINVTTSSTGAITVNIKIIGKGFININSKPI